MRASHKLMHTSERHSPAIETEAMPDFSEDRPARRNLPVGVGVGAAPSLRDLVAGSSAGIGFLNTDLRYVQGNAVLAATLGVSSVINLTPSTSEPQAAARTPSCGRSCAPEGPSRSARDSSG